MCVDTSCDVARIFLVFCGNNILKDERKMEEITLKCHISMC